MEPEAIPPARRASDAERDRVADLLRGAMGEGRLTVDELDERMQAALAARTHDDLLTLLTDLMSTEDASRALTVPTRSRPTRRDSAVTADPMPVRAEERERTGWVLGIMGGSSRKGRWRVQRRTNVINFWGGTDLDLTDAELSAEAVDIRIVSIMGGGSIIVPPGADLQVSELALMGGNDIQAADPELTPHDAPVVRVRLISIMGGAEVRRRSRQWDREERALRRRERREQQLERRGRRSGGSRDAALEDRRADEHGGHGGHGRLHP
ncbi:MAG: DUF1707 domain-containing protein [Solirubrobacteraceae bacterium]